MGSHDKFLRTKLLLVVSTVIALLGFGILWFSLQIFGTSQEINCSTTRRASFQIGRRDETLMIDDILCDDGMNVTGAYVVKLYVPGMRSEGGVEVELVRQSNMQSGARIPSLKMTSLKEIEIRSQRDLTVKKGPLTVGEFSVHYLLEK